MNGEETTRLFDTLDGIKKDVKGCVKNIAELKDTANEIRVEQATHTEQIKTLFRADERHDREIEKSGRAVWVWGAIIGLLITAFGMFLAIKG